MANVALQVVVDRPDGLYQAGDVLNGVVQLSAQEAATLTELQVRVEYRTSGRGNRAQGAGTGGEKPQVLAADMTLEPGLNQAYPFSIRLPQGPVSYVGNYINLNWQVVAEAKLKGWFNDVKHATAIILAAARLTPAQQGVVPVNPQLQASLANVGMGCAAAFLGLFALAGLGLMTVGLVTLGSDVSLPMLIGGLLLAGSMGYFTYRVMRNQLARARLGQVTVQLVPPEPVLGQPLTCRVMFTPRRHVMLEEVSFRLIAREIAVSGSGTNTTTHTHILREDAQALALHEQLTPGNPCAYEATFETGAGWPPPFQVVSNRLVYDVRVKVSQRGPDWQADYPVLFHRNAQLSSPGLASQGG